MRPEELKSNLAKAGGVPWSAWHHSQRNICMGRGKVGGWRWECCLRPVLIPGALWRPTEVSLILGIFQVSEATLLVSHVAPGWICHGVTLGWGCSFWGCVQARPAGTQEHATLAQPIYQPQWFTVIDAHIPERFRRNRWLRLGFHLRPLPDKRLNCARSWENTTGEHRSVLAPGCAQGLGKDTSVPPPPRWCRGLSSPLGGPGRLSSKDSSVSVFFSEHLCTAPCGSAVSSVWQQLQAQFQGALCHDKSLYFSLFWLQNRGEAAYSPCFQNWKYFIEHGVFIENRNNAYDVAYRDCGRFGLFIFWVRQQTTVVKCCVCYCSIEGVEVGLYECCGKCHIGIMLSFGEINHLCNSLLWVIFPSFANGKLCVPPSSLTKRTVWWEKVYTWDEITCVLQQSCDWNGWLKV